MAVISFEEAQGKRRGSVDAQGRRSYHREFVVVTDSVNDGPMTVRAHFSCPVIGATYSQGSETDTQSFVTSIDVSEDDAGGGKHWTVSVEYGPSDTGSLPENQLDWPIFLEWDTVQAQYVVWFDRLGNAIVNSAFDRFEDPLLIDDDRPVAVVTRRENAATFDITLAYVMNNSVNASDWNGFPARTVKVSGIKPGKPFVNPKGGWLVEVPYRFEFREDTWDHRILDQGYHELDASSPPRAKPILNQGKPLTEPALLDGSGHRLATNASPVELRFRVYKETDFSILNINLSARYGV